MLVRDVQSDIVSGAKLEAACPLKRLTGNDDLGAEPLRQAQRFDDCRRPDRFVVWEHELLERLQRYKGYPHPHVPRVVVPAQVRDSVQRPLPLARRSGIGSAGNKKPRPQGPPTNEETGCKRRQTDFGSFRSKRRANPAHF